MARPLHHHLRLVPSPHLQLELFYLGASGHFNDGWDRGYEVIAACGVGDGKACAGVGLTSAAALDELVKNLTAQGYGGRTFVAEGVPYVGVVPSPARPSRGHSPQQLELPLNPREEGTPSGRPAEQAGDRA